jgi:hypothetical protein
MKKTILTIVAVAITILSFGQWKTKNYVDEFGEITNSSYKFLRSEDGTFSNSATQNSSLMCDFILDETSNCLTVSVYEYSRNLASSINSSFETIKIKSPSGKIYTIEQVFFTKGGELFFNNTDASKQYDKLIEIFKEKGKYIMVFKRSSTYSESFYKIRFTL